MKELSFSSIKEVCGFLQGSKDISFEIKSSEDKYKFISKILLEFKYTKLKKKEKRIIKELLKRVTKYSDIQLKRLIRQWKKKGLVWQKKKANKGSFKKKYGIKEVARLIETDTNHEAINGNATKEIMKREWEVFKKQKFELVSKMSITTIYNIRKSNRQYNSSEALHYTKTQSTQINIGKREKPQPNGKPGYLRVDSVHQGDKDKIKGVYHINIVDEIVQFEFIGCIERISEEFMKVLLKDLIEQFPFKVINFHSDNGSEYINKIVAKLLNKLLIKQTKSRSRKCNDNALVESKNGSIIRKHMGRNHIPKKYAPWINEFYQKHFNQYLNYHRPCAFATDIIDKKGKIKKAYREYKTPYEKFRSLSNAEQYLKESTTFEKLDKIAYAESDNDFALKMKEAKLKLLAKIKKNEHFAK